MTAVFAAMTVLCLVVLMAMAIKVDTLDREARIATESAQQVELVAAQVDYDADGLNLGGLDSRTSLPDGEVFGVVSGGKIVTAAPSQDYLPTDAGLATIVAAMTPTTPATRFVLPNALGATYRWAAVPVLNLGRVGAVVIVGGPTPGAAEHQQLIELLAITVIVLTILAAAGGHAISGLAMRPALQGLERQEQFLVEASHEMRTPLARLQLILDVDGRDPTLTDRDTIDRAASQVISLSDLVTGLLARAHTQDGKVEVTFRRLRLDQLIETQTRDFPGHDIRFRSLAEAPIVTANPELLAQAVRNLIDNALSHGGRTTVEVSVSARSFTVTDHGPGIRADERDDVRRPGVGAASGTGRGLTIVDWIADLHQGFLTLTDTPGGGLTATVTLGSPPPERTP